MGFDWPDFSGVRAKLDEEIGELDEAIASGNPAEIEHEYGDLLLTVVNMGRFIPATPEEALRTAISRFETRFRYVENVLEKEGDSFHDSSLARLEAIWNEAKEATCS